MTLPAPKSAADCLQYLHLQPHEQAITEARIEEYAVAMARAAAVEAIHECGMIVQRTSQKMANRLLELLREAAPKPPGEGRK